MARILMRRGAAAEAAAPEPQRQILSGDVRSGVYAHELQLNSLGSKHLRALVLNLVRSSRQWTATSSELESQRCP